MRKERSAPVLGDVTIRTCFFDGPIFLKLITMWIVMAAVALLKVAHLADLRSMTLLACNLDMGAGERESGFLMIEGSRAGGLGAFDIFGRGTDFPS